MRDQLLWKVSSARDLPKQPGYSLVRARVGGSGTRTIALIVDRRRIVWRLSPRAADWHFVWVNVRSTQKEWRYIELPGLLDPAAGFSFPEWPEVAGAQLAMVHEKTLFHPSELDIFKSSYQPRKADRFGYCCHCHGVWSLTHKCREKSDPAFWRNLDTTDGAELADTERLVTGLELLDLAEAGLPWDTYNDDAPADWFDTYEALQAAKACQDLVRGAYIRY